MKRLYVSLCMICFCAIAFAQHEFYVEPGAEVYVIQQKGNLKAYSSAPNAAPTLYVNGSLTNNGSITNSEGEIQLTGNWTQAGFLADSGDVVLIGTNAQRLSGALYANDRDFYNLITRNTNLVELDDDVAVSNTLRFDENSVQYVIRTDIASHGNNGNSYANELFIKNDNPNAIEYATVGGISNSTAPFVEGKLRWNIEPGVSQMYEFPIGGEQSGINFQPVSLDFTNPPDDALLAFIEPRTRDFIGSKMFCDINSDGIADMEIINRQLDIQWDVTSQGGFAYDNYTIELFPYAPQAVTAGKLSRSYVTHNETIAGATNTSIVTPFQNEGPGYAVCPTGKILSNQNSFSEFTLITYINRILPVEITSFEAFPVNNEFIQVAWITEAEINNDFFEVQRSTDAINWEVLETVDGAGTMSFQQNYIYNDRTAEHGITYYYRLRQVDFDGTESYVGPDDAKLKTDQLGFTVSEFIPSPAVNQTAIQVTTAEAKSLSYLFYNDLGQIIKQGNIYIPAGSVNHSIDFEEIKNLSASTYFLTLFDGENVFYRTLVKAK